MAERIESLTAEMHRHVLWDTKDKI